MKLRAAGLCCFLPVCSFAQAVPTTPKKFTTRPIGASTATTGVTIPPKATAPEVRQVIYLTLSPERTWSTADGKSRTGKLIAYEESVTVTTNGAAPPVPTSPVTKSPTVVRDGKARLLIDRKAYEVPLDRLGDEERKFIAEVQAAVTPKR